MSATHALLLDVQRRLEALYELDPGAPVTDFLVSDEAARALPGGGSRVLVQEDREGISVGVVLAPDVASRLERQDPRVSLDTGNLGPFCAATEEVSHFLLVSFCARTERSVSQLELELQGEVDKYLSAVTLLALQNEGAVSAHLREWMFQRWHLAPHVEAEGAARYRAASALAWRYTGWIEARFLRGGRLADLRREARRFYRLGQCDKLARIATLQ